MIVHESCSTARAQGGGARSSADAQPGQPEAQDAHGGARGLVSAAVAMPHRCSAVKSTCLPPSSSSSCLAHYSALTDKCLCLCSAKYRQHGWTPHRGSGHNEVERVKNNTPSLVATGKCVTAPGAAWVHPPCILQRLHAARWWNGHPRGGACACCRDAGASRVVYTSHGMLQWHMFTQGAHTTSICSRLDVMSYITHVLVQTTHVTY
jgi:hypothetical protein